MSTPELLFAAVVLFFGVPAAFRNPTATALVVVWCIVTALWYLVPGGQRLLSRQIAEVTILFGLDVMVLTTIFAKPPVRDYLPYGPWRRQLVCLFLEKSLWDRVIIGCFPLIWIAYALPSGSFRWWCMWTIALAQLLAATAEPFEEYRTRRAANAANDLPDNPQSGSEFWALARARNSG